ncbi:MAG: hypothetical protein H0V49_07780 [Nocardioidaceae bacterium]|nr:hypothetical protein [Nocardioidaceae bacterium]
MAANDRPSPAGAAVFVIGCLVAGAVAAFPAAALWVWLAEPPVVAVTSSGAFFGEAELNQQSEVTLWFVAIGALLGLVCGLAVGAVGNRHGVVTVLAVLALCTAASALSAYVGIAVWGPAAPSQPDTGPGVGDVFESSLQIDSLIAYLSWPIGGLAGAVAAITRWPRVEEMPPLPGASDTVASKETFSRGS